jgi:fructose transport system permease protein
MSMRVGSVPPDQPAISAEPLQDAIESELGRMSALRRLRHFLHGYPIVISIAVLIVSVAAFGFTVGHRFFTPFNFSLILQQVTVISVLGAAQTLVVLTAGIDLSVGALMVLCTVVMGETAVYYGVPPTIAIALSFAVGAVAGLVNGVLVTHVRLPPFIATLGTWNVFLALNLWYSGSQTIVAQDISTVAPILQFFGHAMNVGGMRLTAGTLLLFALYAALWYLLNRTAWGRHVFAIGDDEDAARLAGIDVKRRLLSVYVLAGVICALAGWVLIGRIGSVTPQEGQTANLDSITAVVVGGTSLFGGRGSLVATLVGALIVGVFHNGLALAGVDPLWQIFAIGLLIIFAVTIDQWIRKFSV